MKSNPKGTLIRLLISFGAIGAIVYFMRGEIGEAAHILRSDVIWVWFVYGCIGYFLANAILALRLYFVFKSKKTSLSYGDTLYLAFLGLFFNLFFPSSIGGDIAKIYYAYKHTGKKIEATSAVLQDRLVGFIVIISIAVTALFFVSREINDPRISILVYAFLGIMLFVTAFFASRRFARVFSFMHIFVPSTKLKERLQELYHAMYDFKNHRRILCMTLLMSLFGQIAFTFVHYFLALCLGVKINLLVFFLIVPVVAIVSMMPSIGGLGVREAGLIFFLKIYMPGERALVLSILLDMIIYGFSLGAGMLFALKGGLKSQTIHEMEDLETSPV